MIKNILNQWQIQDFPQVGRQPSRGRQHTILPNFPTNCMKLKEFGPPLDRYCQLYAM